MAGHHEGDESSPVILAVMDGYRATDGPARQLLAVASQPSPGDFRMELAVFQRTPARPSLLEDAVRLGVPVTTLPDRFPGDLRTLRAIRACLRARRIDVLQTHGYKANVIGGLLRSTFRPPWIAFLHGETSENLKVRAYFALEKLAVRRADRVCVMSHAMAERIAARGVRRDRIRTIHNAVLFESAEPTEPRSAAPIIAIIGRLSPEKGVDQGLRAFARVLEHVPDARLWVAGQGPEEGRLRAQAQALDVSRSVEWLGYHAAVSSLYARVSILLIPSRSEGLPNVALEAMGHGVPVVASAVGGVPEVVVDGETGLLAPAGDTEALAARLLQVLRDPALARRLGSQERAHVRSRFSLEARRHTLASVYRDLLR
jgi:glycosyltransferase involved in cell wall biosynthesis